MSEPAKVEDETPSSPRRLSNGTVPPPTPLPQTIPDSELLSVREHTFVKTTFSKRAFYLLGSESLFVLILICFPPPRSRNLQGVYAEREEERRALLTMQPHCALQMRSERTADMRPPFSAPPLRALRGAGQPSRLYLCFSRSDLGHERRERGCQFFPSEP